MNFRLGLGRVRGWLAIFIGLSVSNLALPKISDVANEAPIELPKFVVTDSRTLPPPEHWRYTTMPGFEILSNASDRSTQRLVRDFELFRQALSVVWPVPDRMNTPVLLIICGRGGKFDSFIPPRTEGSAETARASLFLKGGNRTAIVIDMESSVLNILSTETDDPMLGTDSSKFSVDHNKQLYREYVHYLLSRSEPRLPAWFEEGMAQIIMAMKFEPDFIEFGKLEDPNTISSQAALTADLNAATAAAAEDGEDTSGDMLAGAPAEDRDFNAALQHKALVPMPKFFAVTYNSPEAVNPLGNNRWAKQAYAFVHLCLYGENGRWQKPFSQFLSRITNEPVSEALFKDCFKMSYKDMLLHLRGYIDFTVYQPIEYTAKKGKGIPMPPIRELRDATESEVGRIKGDALAMAGHGAEARTALIAPYIRGERDPQLLAALGRYEHADGKDDRARKFLDAAAAGKTSDAEALLLLAQMRYADAQAKPGGADGAFSPAQVEGIINLLVPARRQPPPNVAIYELMAQTWMLSGTKRSEPEVGTLIEGVRLFPGRMKLVYQTAVLCAQAGMLEPAHALVEHGLKYAPDAKTKARFEEFRATLPPAPVKADAAPKPAAATKASAPTPAPAR